MWALQYSNTLITCARMQSSHLPPLAPWETCYPAAPLCGFHWGRPVPDYVAVSISAESRVICPVLWDFGLWAQCCEVLAIVLVQQRRKTDILTTQVSAGSSVFSGFWWFFFFNCYFCFMFFTEGLFLALLQTEYRTRTKFLLSVERLCWNIKSYW